MNSMRGMDEMQEALFTTVKLEDFVPADHPLRPIRLLVNQALKRLNGLFGIIYADSGRASIAPEKLVRALLLQVFYSVRSERMLMEQMQYNLLFRWFVGLAIEDTVWNHSVFSKNRDRLLEHEVVESFFTEVMTLADRQGLLSREHFSVDGTLIQAWASHKSFRRKDGSDDPPAGGGRNAEADWKGERRSNDTHESSTDADARLFKKSKQSPAILCYQGHILMENRSGLVVGAVVSHADGFGERASALRLLISESLSGETGTGAPAFPLRHSNVVTFALGNKFARIAWAIASRDAVFELPTRAPVHKRPAFLLTYRSQPIWFCDC
jgi:transposase